MSRITRIVTAGSLGAVLIAGAALASTVDKGGSYASKTGAKYFVSFKVSSSGRQLTALSVPIAVRCNVSAGGFASARTGSAKITKGGTFSVKLPLYGPGGSLQRGQYETVTGKFQSGGREKGTLKYGITPNKYCHGLTVGYSTVVVP